MFAINSSRFWIRIFSFKKYRCRSCCTLSRATYEQEKKKSMIQLIDEFPQPKNTLHNIMNQVTVVLQTLIVHPSLTFHCSNKGLDNCKWTATLSLNWPEKFEIEGIATKKSEAEKMAYLLACQKIKEHGFLNEKNLLVLPQNVDLDLTYSNTSKSDLSNVFQVIWRSLGNSGLVPVYQTSQIKGTLTNTSVWKSEISLKYPKNRTFVGMALRSHDAEKLAASKALKWLHEEGIIDEKKRVLSYSNEEALSLLKYQESPCPIYIPEDLQVEMDQVLNNYKKLKNEYSWDTYEFPENQHALKEEIGNTVEEYKCKQSEIIDVFTEKPYRKIIEDEANSRNLFLFRKQNSFCHVNDEYLQKIQRIRVKLPVAAQRHEILNVINENQVVVLTGETGSGKTTQVPQYILESFVNQLKGSECNIVVTQPRRLSAICIADHVAYERREQVGETIGHQVRLNKKLPQGNGGILFCSTGILLRKLIFNPSLDGVSHVFVDEVHERSVQIDFLLILLKKLILTNKNLKLVLMSASINTGMFSSYFNNCPIISIPGFLYPVKEYFLEDISEDISYHGTFNLKQPVIDIDLISRTVCYIDSTQPPGAILCFLPGWNEIKSVLVQLHETLKDRSKYFFCILHSRLHPNEQKRVFTHPPEGVRKIILSTNIAETSVTIDDVVYVVNSGFQKEMSFDTEKATASLGMQWVTKANVIQRKGRAGRVQPGICYQLFPKSLLMEMEKFPLPEIKRIPLEKVVLDCKLHCPDVKCEEFLSMSLQPPSRTSIQLGIQDLQTLGLLDQWEQPTALGKTVLHFSTHPRLSKALVIATFLRCLDPVLTISAVLTASKEPFSGILEKENIKKVKSEFDNSRLSDHLALNDVFHSWMNCNDDEAQLEFVETHKLDNNALIYIKDLKRLFAEHLVDAGLINEASFALDLQSSVNQNSSNSNVVFATLASAFYPNIMKISQGEISRGKLKKSTITFSTLKGQKATIQSESVISKEYDLPSIYFTYFSAMASKARKILMIPNASPVPQSCLPLLVAQNLSVEKVPDIEPNTYQKVIFLDGSKHRFSCVNHESSLMLQWHNMYLHLLKLYVQKDKYDTEILHQFTSQFVTVLKKLLGVQQIPFKRDKRFYFKDGKILSCDL